MRPFKLSAAFATVLMGGAVASAGVIGTVSIAAQLTASDPTPTLARAATSQVLVDGRVPVRLQRVESGAFVPAARGKVTFARDGRAVYRVDEIDGGTIQAEGLAGGGYSVFVNGEDGFAAFATWVDMAAAGDTADDAIVSVGLVPASDMPTVSRLIRARQTATATPNVDGQHLVSASSTPVSTRNTRSLSHGSDFVLSTDGTLRGRVVRNQQTDGDAVPVQASHVYFVRDNEVVGETVSDADGLFVLQGLASGVYSLVATRGDSIVALAVRVAPHESLVTENGAANPFSQVAFENETMVTDVAMTYSADAPVFEETYYEYEEDDEILAGDAPMNGGSMGGGSGGAAGGGGFGGGGPGLGALLLGAGLGAGIYAIADDDNGGGGRISPKAP